MIVRPTLHEPPSPELPRQDAPTVWRVIKRYSNRKLYDTQSSRYVTLLQIAEMVRSGEEIRIIDNQTHEDKTEVTFALIISEQLKAKAAEGSALSLLKALICEAPAHALPQAREAGPSNTETATLVTADWATPFEQWRATFERRLAHLPDGEASVLRSHVQDLNDRLVELQRRVATSRE